jgi:hypothetical protein
VRLPAEPIAPEGDSYLDRSSARKMPLKQLPN